MNILTTIEVDVEKFFRGTGTDLEKFGAAFVKYLKKVPSAAQAVDNFLGELAPEVVAAVALIDPAADPAVAGAFAIVEAGVGAIGASAAAAVSGTSLLQNLQNFAATVPSILTGIAVKNPALQAKVQRIVALVVNEAKVLIPAVEAWVAQIAAKNPPPAA